MKWILIVVGVIAGLIALMAVIGALLPKGHAASRSTVINKPPEVLWQTMTDCAAFPQWRDDIKTVEVLPAAQRGRLCHLCKPPRLLFRSDGRACLGNLE